MKAIGLNRAEVMFRNGQYLESPELPSKLGYEAAGVVAAVGPDVDNSWLGKKVSTVPAFLMTDYGVYGEVAIVPASALAVYPEKLTPGRGHIDLDAISDGLWSADYPRSDYERRLRDHHRSQQQRGNCRHRNGQGGRRDQHRHHANIEEKSRPCSRSARHT